MQETQQIHDPITGENTTWQIPEYQSPPRPSTMDILKKVVNKKIKNINDGINNLSQQITGRNKTPQKGTYAEIPMENVLDYKRQQNVLKRFDEDMLNENDSIKKRSNSQLYELIKRDNYDGNDPLDIEYFLKNRRNGIQDGLRDIYETDQKTKAASTIKAYAKRNENKKGIEAVKSILSKRIAANKIGELQNKEDATAAATTISSALRGHKGRKEHSTRAKAERLRKYEDVIKNNNIGSDIAQKPPTKR